MVNAHDLEKYKKGLEAEQAKLLKEIESAEERPDTFGLDPGDEDEQADEVEEFGNQLGIVKVKKGQLEEIEVALSKIEKGTYGKCDGCGGEISDRVLTVAPESYLCESCKRKENRA